MNGFARTLVVVLLSVPALVAGQAVFESTFANKDASLQPIRRCPSGAPHVPSSWRKTCSERLSLDIARKYARAGQEKLHCA
jgi:hypothetical protein